MLTLPKKRYPDNQILNTSIIISSHSLTKYYGQSLGVDNISFDVIAGEIFGFLGPNGAGKTTTIRILLDLLRPTSGRVEIFGMDVRKESFNIRKQIGYLPGEFSAYDHLSGIEFFKLISKIRKVSFDEGSTLFRRFDLSEKDLSKKIKALSHGTLQKIGIIQALFHKPGLLILDEPTTGLDPLMKEVFYELLLEEQQKGTTIFFSSHNLDEVEKLCQRVAIIRKGKIVGLECLDVLKERAGRILEFTLAKDKEVVEIPGARLIRQVGKHYMYRLESNINPVLKSLSAMPVLDVSISKPDLEGIFVEYYQDKENHQNIN